MSGILADKGQHDDRGRELLAGSRPPADGEWLSEVAELYAAHRDSLLRFAMSRVQDRQTAEDVVQESFERFLRMRPTLETPERELAYLHAIVRNAALSTLIRQQRLSPLPYRMLEVGRFGSELYGAEEEVVANSQASDMADVLRELPCRQRETLALAIDGFQPSEIARILGIEPNTVRVNLHHGRAKVRARLAAGGASAA